MTDSDVVQRAAAIFGAKMLGPYKKPNPKHKSVYQVSLIGSKAVGWMMILFQFMGDRRRTRIKEILAYWKETPNRGRNLKGQQGVRPFTPGPKGSRNRVDPK